MHCPCVTCLDLQVIAMCHPHELRPNLRCACDTQVRKPLSALRTLGAMLLPRLQEGRPDRDMASGILVQVTCASVRAGSERAAGLRRSSVVDDMCLPLP